MDALSGKVGAPGSFPGHQGGLRHMNAILRRGTGRLALVALTALTAVLFAACTTGGGGGGGGFNPQPGEQPPSIFGLSKSSANVGEQLDILGSNFGATVDD